MRPQFGRLENASHIGTILILAGVYFAAAKLGLRLAFLHPSATPVWPPTGIALAALLMFGYRAGPGIFLGAFLANLTTYGTVWTSLGIATGNTLEGLFGAYLVTKYANGSNVFDHPRDIFKFAALAAVVSTTISATIGVSSLALGGFAAWGNYRPIWLTWWLGDAAGALIFAPLLILFGKNLDLRWNRQPMFERGLFLLTLLVVSWIVFGGLFPFAYLTVPFLIWAAFRFDRRETAAVIVLLTLIAVWATIRHLGPFVGATPNESLLLLQAFMGIMAMVALPLASVVAERKAVEQEAKDLLLQLHSQKGFLEYTVRERTQQVVDAEHRRAAELARSNTLITALSNVAAHLVAGSTPDSVMQTLGDDLKALGMDCAVTSLDSETSDLIVQYASVESRALALAEKLAGIRLHGFRVKRERFPVFADLVERQRSLFIPAIIEIAIAQLPHLARPIAEQALRLIGIEPTTSAIFMPLTVGGSVVGTMGVWGRDVQEGDITALSVFAGHVTVSMEKARLFEQAERRLAQLQIVHDIDVAISASTDLRLTLNVFLDKLTTQLGVDAADILLLNPAAHMLEYMAGRGFRTAALQHTRLRIGEGYAGKAVADQRTIAVSDLRAAAGELHRAPLLPEEGFVSYVTVPLVSKGQVSGALEIFHRSPLVLDEEWLTFAKTLAGQAAIAVDNATLFDGIQRANADLVLAYDTTLEGWSRALDLRDRETEGHTQRVVDLALRLARALNVPDDELVHTRRGALLHDIGKMGIPDSILLKPGPLTENEWEIMRKHPTYAYEWLSPIAYLRPALDIPYCHHERWDGTGYPRRLKGEEIPLVARIFAVADVWDALTSDRPYRPAWTREQAMNHISEQAGKNFDPLVVETFLHLDFAVADARQSQPARSSGSQP